ncbi:phosphatidylinositol-glycan biosynthesis class S protein-domain-containing protein [Trametes maxima]|nr:phosphatidylinositol-glycan biosynthesis class S protein-domain-containing protein [Trametes maxima]
MTSANPSELCFENVRTRRLIIASYWTVVLLAIPLWWKTTSIERLSLPTSRVYAERSRELSFPVEVNVATWNKQGGKTLVQDVQARLQPHKMEAGAVDVKLSVGERSDVGYNVVFDHGGAPVVEGRELHLNVHPEDGSKYADYSTIVFLVILCIAHDVSGRLADILTKLLNPYSTHSASRALTQHVMKYSPRYRLAFTLLNEDATSGNAALMWDIQGAIQKHFVPLLEKLSYLHNFTIESQVQFHAPLAFEPRRIQHDGREAHGLTQEDLTVFINSAEWTLSSSVSNDPVIHFVLFIPSSSNSPLHILDNEGSLIQSNAFLLPQWGGIILFNPAHDPSILKGSTPQLNFSDLSPIFNTFAYQLLTLLGVPGLPANIQVSHESDGDARQEPFTDWELDALLRWRASENVQSSMETLEAIVRLVGQIENMPVGQDVVGDVQHALEALSEAREASRRSPVTTLKHSSRALTLTSRAFFNPGMLALLYFPAEHTYAVYTPLFASVAAPLIGAVLRELMAWKRARKASQGQGATAETQDDRKEGAKDE